MIEPKISVIIPVYNVEQLVRRCIISVINQTMQEGVEVIIVNDCTTDRSMEIIHRVIDEYKDKTLMTFCFVEHQINRGLAAARISAMKQASGDYTIHIDSDDYVEPKMLETMYSQAVKTDADIVVSDYFRETDNESIRIYINDTVFMSDVVLGKQSYLWNKLIRRSLYVDNHITWAEGVDFREDYIVSLPLCFAAEKTVFLPDAFYHYVIRPDSITRGGTLLFKKIYCWIYSADHLLRFIKDRGISDYEVEVACMLLQVRFSCLISSSGEKRKEYIALYPEADKYKKYFIKTSETWKISMFRYLVLNNYFSLYTALMRINHFCKGATKNKSL